MKKYLAISVLLIAVLSAGAQIPAHLEGRISYPVFDQQPWIGVIDVPHNALEYDATVEYKVMLDVYEKLKNNADAFSPLNEAARTYNLISELGVPEEKIHVALIIHGSAVDAFLSQEAYQKKFGRENPNMALIEAMKDKGVRFYVCSQSLGYLNIPNDDLSEQVEVALSAKTAMITLDQRGYSYLNVNED